MLAWAEVFDEFLERARQIDHYYFTDPDEPGRAEEVQVQVEQLRAQQRESARARKTAQEASLESSIRRLEEEAATETDIRLELEETKGLSIESPQAFAAWRDKFGQLKNRFRSIAHSQRTQLGERLRERRNDVLSQIESIQNIRLTSESAAVVQEIRSGSRAGFGQ